MPRLSPLTATNRIKRDRRTGDRVVRNRVPRRQNYAWSSVTEGCPRALSSHHAAPCDCPVTSAR